MQASLPQITKTREEGKEMKQITEYELKFMSMFIETGIQMIPNSDRSAYNSDSDYEFSQFVTDRLKKFYELYKPVAEPQVVGDKEW
jgi:hypothetical protein